MNSLYLCFAEVVCFDNDNDAFVPEKWAMEGLLQLEESMVMAGLVHRDFQNEIAQFGDTVNTRKPSDFNIVRKVQGDTLSYQDAQSTNVAVKLDQWFTQPFTIYDGEESMAFKDLVSVYLTPAMRTIARGVDRAILGQMHRFLTGINNRVGRLENLAADTSDETVLEAREVLNVNLAPMDEERHLIVSAQSETALLKNKLFISAEQRGDGGSAMENARLGRIFGFNTWMGQNVPSVSSAASAAGVVDAAEAAGKTGAITTTLAGTAANVGEFVNLAGNDQPTYCTATTGATAVDTITLHEALKYATESGAVMTVYAKDTVDHPTAGTYAIGWSKYIDMDTIASWSVGQLCAFGAGANRRTYTVIAVVGDAILLDRPLEVAVADGADAFPGPKGNMNLAFHREALALVTRPLALPRPGTGALAGVANYNNVAMRISMQYDQALGGTKVNCDILAGLAMLDVKLACVLLG